MKLLKDVDVSGRRVMVRSGLDLPLDLTKDLLDPSRVKDDIRIKDIVPTLKYLVENNAKIILAAGWSGRPKGVDPDFSMAPVAKRIEQILNEEGALKHPVLVAPDCYEDKKPKSTYANKDEVKAIVDSLNDGQIVVLENVRYDPEANADDKDFAAFIASLADVYVNDNETQNHRKEATVVTTPLLVAEKGGDVVFGFKYMDVLEKIGGLKHKLESPDRRSFVFGLCGKKIETDPGITSKITVTLGLIDVMKEGDAIITGGAVTYTFLLAQHYSSKIEENMEKVNQIVKEYDNKIVSQTKDIKDKKKAADVTAKIQKQKSEELKNLIGITDEEIKNLIGSSYIRWGQEGEQIVFAYNVMAKANAKGVDVITAYDHIITNNMPNKVGILPEEAEIKVQENITGIPDGWLGVGTGPKTLKKLSAIIENAGIYLQSGPFSIEDKRVEDVSKTDARIFEAVKKCKGKGGISIGAGGDTVARIKEIGAEDAFSTITSAGGATLELIETGTSKGKDSVEKAQSILE
ncbi:MAG: phosphoglycerate kinase [bacterium]|nr:phosphoglycerate kinase [bacterium]